MPVILSVCVTGFHLDPETSFPLIWLLTGGGPPEFNGYHLQPLPTAMPLWITSSVFASAAVTVGLVVTMIFTYFYVKRQKAV